jgi:hypothetical protein
MSNFRYEGLHPGSFILRESEGTLSRDNATISGGTVVQTGQVLGQITATGSFVPWNPAANDGSQNACALPVYKYDVVAGDVKGVILARNCSVIADQIVWPVGVSPADKAAAIAALKKLNILVR